MIEVREDPSTTIRGPSWARQKKRHLMAFRWCADDDPTLNDSLVAVIFQGIRTGITRKPYIFVIFQGRGPDPCPHPPLDPHTECNMVTCLPLNFVD